MDLHQKLVHSPTDNTGRRFLLKELYTQVRIISMKSSILITAIGLEQLNAGMGGCEKHYKMNDTRQR